jgi:hypothetical protein
MDGASPQAVTVNLTYQLRLAVHYFNGALGAGVYTLTTAGALFFINFDYVSHRHR